MPHQAAPALLRRARLPRWLLGEDWPLIDGEPALADIRLHDGRLQRIEPAGHADGTGWDLAGAPVLPAFVEAHAHLDKTLTLHRLGEVRPGLLGAIEAMMHDRADWTETDIHERASQALQWAWEAGVTRLRTHCDWWEMDSVPTAWHVLRELAEAWRGRIRLDRAALIPLGFFAERDDARRLARKVAGQGGGTHLGGFVHSTNWNPVALRHLVEAAQEAGLGLDLHIDEELNPEATGLAALAGVLTQTGFDGPVVCGHACALAAQEPERALATLDVVARTPITLVSLPATNLLLQDAQGGRTPRTRGLTLLKEARARGIPLLIGSDNVQDPFCPIGEYDPVQALSTGVLAAQLESPFDVWSEAICRADWLDGSGTPPAAPGSRADLVIFPKARAHGFPGRAQTRIVLRDGRPIEPTAAPCPLPTASWTAVPPTARSLPTRLP